MNEETGRNFGRLFFDLWRAFVLAQVVVGIAPALALERDGVIVRRQGSGCFLTGRQTELAAAERRRQLYELMQRAATEAFHLGFAPAEIEKALVRCLRGLKFDDEEEDA